MASLSDLMAVFGSAPPAGFSLAETDIASTNNESMANIGRERVLRDFNKFQLPDLLGSQAARGAFHSSATRNKQDRLTTAVGDELGNIQLGLANANAQLASNALLAQTGFRLGNV